MKVLVSLAMSNTKAIAESFVTNQLPQVLENLVKVAFFEVQDTTIQEWQDEIADKHLAAIRKCVNNVKTKKGHLSKDVIVKVWHEVLTEDSVYTSIRVCSRNPKYKTLKRSLLDIDMLVKVLAEEAEWFAFAVTINHRDQDDIIAARLVQLAKSTAKQNFKA